MYKVVLSSRFRKDYSRCFRRGMPVEQIDRAMRILASGEALPAGFVVELSKAETDGLRSKRLTANISPKSRVAPKVFTERGLYMLATILKSKRAGLGKILEMDRRVA